MVKDAIAKLRNEMAQNNSNPYIQVVGEYLINHLNSNPEAAEKILNTDKTVGKSLEEMRKAASGKKVGGVAVLTDQEGFDIVLKYFDIDTKTAQNVTEGPKTVTETIKTVSKDVDFDLKLEDLI